MWRILGRRRTFRLCALLLVCRFDLSIGLPTEQPTRFTLSTGDRNLENMAVGAESRFAQGRAFVAMVVVIERVKAGCTEKFGEKFGVKLCAGRERNQAQNGGQVKTNLIQNSRQVKEKSNPEWCTEWWAEWWADYKKNLYPKWWAGETIALDQYGGRIKNNLVQNAGQELLGGIADALRIGTGRLVNSVTLTRNIIADRAESLASESRNNPTIVTIGKSVAFNEGEIQVETTTQYPPVTNTHATARETVRLENETGQSLLEKPFSKPITGVLESFLSPTPLVDGIKEQEKYGNSGDKFIGIGRALVSSFEGFSNFLNAIIDFPRNAAKKTSRGITEALNHVGARLIGLE
ncbi:PREDICTED: uncharacterized protein LOC108579875 [Habropoda laboriosa]|uniref:uncharacterized protein LOC108579875 n=1 Tax=Habropoda laboriosa TaxID=597456 RepID=UPI00083DBEB8|nr:PREDICTED: uncharacterized protein LOC108579875 [Habropoda laboriosa]